MYVCVHTCVMCMCACAYIKHLGGVTGKKPRPNMLQGIPCQNFYWLFLILREKQVLLFPSVLYT